MFDVLAPVSPSLYFVGIVDGNAVYHVVEYSDDCDEFKVTKVLKFDIETGNPVE